MIKVKLNGHWISVKACPLTEALEEWGYQSETFAIAINHEFVPQSCYQNHQLQEGDALEILSPMQGG